MRRLKRGNNLLARNRGKGVHKFFNAVASFEVIDEIPERDPGALEYRCAAEDVWIAVDDRCRPRHDHLFPEILAATLNARHGHMATLKGSPYIKAC